mgnify:FL=1
MKRRTLIRDRSGEGYVDVAISILIIFVVIAGIFAVFPIYTTYQTLNATARQIAHVVEVCGQADDATVALATGREGFIEPDAIVFDTTWLNPSTKKIQLKTPFTVTISKQVVIPILRPLTGSPIGFHVNVNASASGISEVYWKE